MEDSVPKNGWQIGKSMSECMLQMFHAQLWTDISFRCFDQRAENQDDRVKAHKIVLAARSPVFEAMFFGPCKDGETVVEIQDAESKHFKKFLEFLYSDGEGIVYNNEDLIYVLQIAHKYQVQTVFNICCDKLNISDDNACFLLDLALYFEDANLTKTVCTFIDNNAEYILDTDGFLNISQRGLVYVLQGDTFLAPEVKIFERAIAWAKQRCKSSDGKLLRQTLGEAFYYLRTPIMAVSDFFSCSKRKGFYSMEEYEDIIERIVNPSQCTRVITSNCETRRRPAMFWIKRLPKTEITLVKGQRKESISETILMSVAHESVLTSLKLDFNKSKVISPDHRTLCQQVEKRFESIIDIAVMVDNMNLEYKVHRRENSLVLELLYPLPLQHGKTYRLWVKKESKIKGHYLVPKICNDPVVFQVSCCRAVSVRKILSGSENPSIILQLEFQSKSNRI